MLDPQGQGLEDWGWGRESALLLVPVFVDNWGVGAVRLATPLAFVRSLYLGLVER